MEHTANIMNPNEGLMNTLLKLFAMFELRLIYDIDKVESIAIRSINFRKRNSYIFSKLNIRRNDH